MPSPTPPETSVPHLSRRAALRLALGSAAALPAAHLYAQPAPGALARIILAGRQPMLSQLMSRAVLYGALGIERDKHLALLERARDQYANGLIALDQGSRDFGPEPNDGVREILKAVDGVWSSYRTTIDTILGARDIKSSDVNKMLSASGFLLLATYQLTRRVSFHHAAGINFMLTVAIDIAGRQRMMTQKLTTDAAQIGLGLRPNSTRKIMGANVDLFEKVLGWQINSNPNLFLFDPPQSALRSLRRTEALWQDFAPVLRTVAQSGIASTFDLQAISRQSDPLLRSVDEAMDGYIQDLA